MGDVEMKLELGTFAYDEIVFDKDLMTQYSLAFDSQLNILGFGTIENLVIRKV